MTQMLLGISPEWKPTFSNFVSGRNRELLTALEQALPAIGTSQSIYIWGDAGGGKSHLLQAAVQQALESGRSAEYASGKVPVLSDVPGVAEVVAVDDVERLDEEGQIEMFALYNRQRESGGVLLVSGNAAPAQLAVRDDLRTRLGWGLVYQVQPLNDEEKAAALQQHAGARGFTLPQEVTQYLLRHGRRDLPSLLATLDALDERCLQLKRMPSVPLLKEVMSAGFRI